MLCAERGRPGRLLNEEDSDPPATTQDMVVPASSGDIVSNKWTSHGHPKKPHLAPTQRIPVKMTQVIKAEGFPCMMRAMMMLPSTGCGIVIGRDKTSRAADCRAFDTLLKREGQGREGTSVWAKTEDEG